MNEKKPTPFIRTFDEAEPYPQEEDGEACFNRLLHLGEIPGLCMGRVRLKGPMHKKAAAHADWDQVYLVFRGSATMHLDGESRPVSGPTVIVIPRNTPHSVELQAGEEIDYAYINQYFTE